METKTSLAQLLIKHDIHIIQDSEYRNLEDILIELAQKWDDITEEDKYEFTQ